MHPKLLYFRHKLFRYRQTEQQIADGKTRLLDVGCGDGENMLRFQQTTLEKVGIEVSFKRLQTAQQHGLTVQQASGTTLPFADNSFDMLYIAHVLHHVADFDTVLREIERVVVASGSVFVVETVTDHPLLRLARWLHPVWQGDEVEANWRYAQLYEMLTAHGFRVEQTERYNVIFFLWEMLPLAFWPFELFTPLFIYLDLLLARFLHRYSAHCYFVLRRMG